MGVCTQIHIKAHITLYKGHERLPLAVLGDAGKERVEWGKHGIGWGVRTLRSLYPSRASKVNKVQEMSKQS